MNKKNLIETLASRTDLAKTKIDEIMTTLEEVVTEELSKGGEVVLTGFGKFTVSQRKARIGINPRTREKIQIPASKSPKFTSGQRLKDAVKK